jgi:uncharacterized lipoprotein YehR (DUF1307 family)
MKKEKERSVSEVSSVVIQLYACRDRENSRKIGSGSLKGIKCKMKS